MREYKKAFNGFVSVILAIAIAFTLSGIFTVAFPKRVLAAVNTANQDVTFFTDTELSNPERYVQKGDFECAVLSVKDYSLQKNKVKLNLTNIDGFQISYKSILSPCSCGTPTVQRRGRVTYAINGQNIYQVIDCHITNNIDEAPLFFSDYADITNSGLSAGETEFDIFSPYDKCMGCGEYCERIVMTKNIYLFDNRGVCEYIDSYAVNPGDTVILTPRYNQYTVHADYKIKYAGDKAYRNIIYGKETNGMTVTAGADRTIIISGINKSKGNFDILPVPYDRSGSLPFGFNESTETKVSHITVNDVEKPVITRKADVYDRINGTVTVEFSATDNEPLPANCYSFDGGEYSSVKTQKYSTVGNHKVSVKDAAGNVATLEYAITEADILKNDLEKPVIKRLDNIYDRINGTVTVEFTATDNRPLLSDCFSFDGGVYSSVRTQKYSTPGKHKVSVKDAAGNVATLEYTITEADVLKNDTQKPIITRQADKFDRINGIITVSFSATDDRALPTNCFSFDDGEYLAVNSQKYSVPGKHRVSVKDAAGNVATLEYTITEADVLKNDTEKPEIHRLTNIYDRDNGTVTVTFIATDNRTLPADCYSFDGGVYSSIRSQKYSTPGKHIISVKDGAGNISSLEYTITEEDLITRDTQKPTIIRLQNIYDRVNGTVTVEFTASDNRPLPADCFSFDNGAYSSNRRQTYSEDGQHIISVKDAAGNVAVKEYLITKADVMKPQVTNPINPNKPTNPNDPNNPSDPSNPKEPYKGQPIGNDPITDPKGTTGELPVISSSSSRSSVPGGIDDPKSKYNKEHEITVSKSPSSSSSITGEKIINSNKKDNSSSERKASELSETKKNSLFESIKTNSGKYVTTQEEIDKALKEKKAMQDELDKKIESKEKDSKEYKGPVEMDDSLMAMTEAVDNYVPEKRNKNESYVILISVALLIVVALAIFGLFFMVLLFAECDSDIFAGEKKKKIIGIRVVTMHKKHWSLNVNDLLSEYPTIEAYLGVLFVYLFEGEYMKILSKVRGDDKREIAREVIKKTVVIGKGKGRKR